MGSKPVGRASHSLCMSSYFQVPACLSSQVGFPQWMECDQERQISPLHPKLHSAFGHDLSRSNRKQIRTATDASQQTPHLSDNHHRDFFLLPHLNFKWECVLHSFSWCHFQNKCTRFPLSYLRFSWAGQYVRLKQQSRQLQWEDVLCFSPTD